MNRQDPPVIVWLRRDLRLADNPALAWAAQSGRPVIPLYIHDVAAAGRWAEGGAQRWWLHHALTDLGAALARLGAPLWLGRGDSPRILPELVERTGATTVLWNRRYEPWASRRDALIKAALRGRGIDARSFNANLLYEPWQIVTGAGTPFKVFTPFWRACRAAGPPPRPEPAPGALRGVGAGGEDLDTWGLLPRRPDWAGGLRAVWRPGEVGAAARLVRFLDEGLADYAEGRDRPGRDLTSGLSPHLHFGEIGPRQVFHAVQDAMPGGEAQERFLAELGWREFAYHLLHQAPDLPERPLRRDFDRFCWNDDEAAAEAWRRGRTGYPIVDAGMRQLWATGWMHNRVRMIAASFLIKDLLVPWQVGAAWFWDTLVDADLASNSAGWQWVAGCGADAAPFFRVFNPVTQGEKFDPDGAYVRRWCPELSALPDRWLHRPWQAPLDHRPPAGAYPPPMVGHDRARRRALAAFQAIKA